MTIHREAWGEVGGRPVDLYTLSGESGMEASVSTYGGVVVRLSVPDSHGNVTNVTQGYDSLKQYLDDPCYFGCIVGRVANRIGNARFSLNGEEYVLDRNSGNNQLHGGSKGFHTRVWEADAAETTNGPSLSLTRTSPDGEQGYPGTLEARVDFTLLEHGLRLDFSATTDRPTPVSMTNHSYFNLSGDLGSSCHGHRLTIPAGRILETDTGQVPTGALTDVTGTPFDFRSGPFVGERIDAQDEGLVAAGGYDHYFVLDDDSGELKLAGSVVEPESGRGMELRTTCPGIQFYSGNNIPEGLPGRGGTRYGPRCGFCLEAHGYVDEPNHSDFPSVILEPGRVMRQTIIYTFFA